MQLLVYAFIAVAAVALGATGYFGLAFTPIESGLVAVSAFCLGVVILERNVHARSEKRLEKAIDDLSRLLSTDAQAGQVLSQRINTLTDLEPAKRLNSLEADLSVLGTVVGQVAEAVAELENAIPAPGESGPPPAPNDRMPEAAIEPEPEPAIPQSMLRQALGEDRLIFHMQPVMALPSRRPRGYDLVPRLLLEEGDLADAPDFMPIKGGEDLVRRIELAGLEEAVTLVRRARATGQPATVYVPVTGASLSDAAAGEALIELFEANRAVSQGLALKISHKQWRTLGGLASRHVAEISALGLGFVLTGLHTLRLDFADLAGRGVQAVRVSAAQFAGEPASLTDFHSSDVADYLARFGVDLVVEDVRSEQQVLTALEDGVRFAIGPHLAPPGPARADLLVRRGTAAEQRVRAT